MSKIWKPVEDGDLHSFLAVQDNGETVAVFVNDDYGYAEESLPDEVRLCRLVPDEGVLSAQSGDVIVESGGRLVLSDLEFERDLGYALLNIATNMQVPDEGGVLTRRMIDTIRSGLRRERINIEMSDLSSGHLASELADVDAALAWLQQQKGGNDE